MIESKTSAAEYRALGRLMRHARAEGYTYRISSAFGRSDWSWSKDHKYAVVAEPLTVGWKVTFNDGRADLWPASVQQLTDVLVALGLLPVEFRSAPTVAPQSVEPKRVADVSVYYSSQTGSHGWRCVTCGDESRPILPAHAAEDVMRLHACPSDTKAADAINGGVQS